MDFWVLGIQNLLDNSKSPGYLEHIKREIPRHLGPMRHDNPGYLQISWILGQAKFPKFLNTPPQNLQMVDLVWASAKKFDFNPSNQPRIGLQHFMWLNLQYKTKKLTRPNFKIPFDYNLLFLVVVHENIVCPTTFIAKTWKFMGTSVYSPRL